MICKGQDRCLYVFPVTEFGRVTDALRNAPVTDRRVRDYGRVLFASASNEKPDGQGRITVPPTLRQYAGADQGLRRHRREHPHRGLGRGRVAGVPRGHRAGVRRHRRGGAARRPLTPSPPHRTRSRWVRPPPVHLLAHLPRCQAGRAGTRSTPSPTPPHHRPAARPGRTDRRPTREPRRWTTGRARRRWSTSRPSTSRCCSSACSPCSAPALADRPAVAVDATLGLGGHAEALLAAHPQLTLVGLDRDPDALARSRARLAPYAARTHLVHAVYDRMPEVLDELGLRRRGRRRCSTSGVSSMQLDVAERGFAYAQDAPLDMRMDQAPGRPPSDVVNTYPVRRARPDPARVRRGALRAAHRPGHRPRAPGGPAAVDRAAGRAGARGDSRRDAPARGPPGQTHVPGAAHRGERRAGRGARRRAGRPRRARASAAGSSCWPTTRSRTAS